MADQKVSDLPALNGADVDTADLLYIIDSSAGTAGSKRITIGQFQVAPYSGGAANQIQYLNASKVLTGSSGLTFDGTNFSTTGTATATKLIPTGNVTAGNGMYLPTTNTLAWSNNGSETMRLDSSGNLGLGVTPSAWSGARAFQMPNGVFLSANSGTTTPYMNLGANTYFDGTNWIYSGSFAATRYDQLGGAHRWYNAPSGTAGNTISFTQAMTLDASGNLGIGVTSMSNALEIKRGAGANAYIEVAGNGNNPGITSALFGQNGSSIAYCWNRANAELLFGTNDTERARITSGGNLLVGTTSGNERLRVSATNNAAGFVNTTAASATAFSWNQATSGDNLFYDFGTEASYTARGSIDYNRAGGLVRYNTTSDYRAKDILGPVANPGATIDALKVYEGVMKGATQSRPMLVAHEAQEHAPYAVSGVKDQVNDDGTPKFQQMDVSSLVPLLIAEIQSLRARVAALENQP